MECDNTPENNEIIRLGIPLQATQNKLTASAEELARAKGLLVEWRHVTYKSMIPLQDKTDAFLNPPEAEGADNADN